MNSEVLVLGFLLNLVGSLSDWVNFVEWNAFISYSHNNTAFHTAKCLDLGSGAAVKANSPIDERKWFLSLSRCGWIEINWKCGVTQFSVLNILFERIPHTFAKVYRFYPHIKGEIFRWKVMVENRNWLTQSWWVYFSLTYACFTAMLEEWKMRILLREGFSSSDYVIVSLKGN